ncbi:hypothetical protein [Mannheimia sp. ZY171111]|uniref:hypothetical protein n=1 Tax=Mannheimia sp. ZY171111 TaxID=2679995 RepID=UPI001ADD97A7|nr:hypothetical protein [Mannheimia sp. ZY171111]QTM01257.1 hypothetical protein GM698_06480 [Mannheimia sp. ZY171111]
MELNRQTNQLNMNDNCAFRVYFNRIAHDKYTYDNYDRVATRSFDTDSKKEGDERTEKYTYDQYGYIINVATDILGDNIAVNTTRTIERDLYGRTEIYRDYQANGSLLSKHEYDYNEYGYITKLTSYSSETQKSFINHYYKRDSIGRVEKLLEDKNANEIFDAGDLKQTLIYDQYIDSKYAERIDESVLRKKHNIYTYDDYQRISSSFEDKNGNKTHDSYEPLTKRFYFGESGITDRFEFYTNGKLTLIQKYVYPDAGNIGNPIAQLKLDVAADQYALLYGLHGFHYSSEDDYTSDNWSKLLDNYANKINQINLTNATASTHITLDHNTVAKIAKDKTLLINGDATDTVKLKDYGEFTKAAETVKIGSNTYDKLTTEVEGKTYTLLVDTDIKLFDAAHPGTEII